MPTQLADWTAAAASGVLLVLSFPKFGHPVFAWIALAPLLLALVSRVSMLRAFGLGLTTGVIYFAGTLYWMSGVMGRYGGLNTAVAIAVNAAFVAYVALYPALFAVVMRRLTIAFEARALLAAPFVWTATELGRSYLFTGFPWVPLGNSQATFLSVAQAASVFGVFGLSALVASASAAVAAVVLRRAFRPAAMVAAGIALVAVWGHARARAAALTHEGTPIRVALLQPNVLEEERENVANAPKILQRDLTMTREALANDGVSLVVWPESGLSPYTIEDYPQVAALIRGLAVQAHVPILVGSDQYQWGVVDGRREVEKSYNAAFLIRRDGTTGAVYRKMHLVPWGEYVPLKDWLTFVGPLVQAIGRGFDAGTTATLLPVGTHEISTAICYEIIYPDLVRRFVLEGSELLTTITNDSWFGATSAPYQHFEQASLRAIEEGRYLVRAANTGVSGIVDPYGHVLARSAIYQQAVVVGDARLLTGVTIYARTGDVFAYASAVVTLLLLVAARARRV
ncbi:MAG TPA: apolipoprotein N-acyltransferase [Vicinamibacterales bacterium]|nr:apolipoprotein N-acyltransferase [Vicinamibacterales bacterium]